MFSFWKNTLELNWPNQFEHKHVISMVFQYIHEEFEPVNKPGLQEIIVGIAIVHQGLGESVSAEKKSQY